MIYRFFCPCCGNKVELRMPVTEYKAEGHICECGAELLRDPHDFGTNYSVRCDGFYAANQSE